MFSALKNLFAFILILTILAVPTTLFLVKFDNVIPAGSIIKRQFIHYPILVQLAHLNQPGDFRYLYLNSSSSTINVNIVYAASVTPDPKAPDWIQQMINQTTGKDAHIFLSPTPLPNSYDFYSTADLNQICADLASTHPQSPFVNIVYLTTYADKPSYAGLVIHADTLFIFEQGLHSLTSSATQRTRLEQSTLMHEWGHLLGLEHTDLTDCIMASSVDVYQGNSAWKNHIPTTYCWTELDQLNSIKQ